MIEQTPVSPAAQQSQSAKFPDPLEQKSFSPVNSETVAKQEVKKRQSFWWSVAVVLVFIPIAAAVLIIVNRLYVNIAARRAVVVPSSETIDAALVVTPEQLPTPNPASQSATTEAKPAGVLYTNEAGYAVVIPADIVAATLDQPPQNPTETTSTFRAMPKEEYDRGVVDNYVEFALSDSEPAQTATQSATRDFTGQEFKVYDYPTQRLYVGQLPKGKWLQLKHQYRTVISVRQRLENVISTVQILTE